jgi:hypothetical protein
VEEAPDTAGSKICTQETNYAKNNQISENQTKKIDFSSKHYNIRSFGGYYKTKSTKLSSKRISFERGEYIFAFGKTKFILYIVDCIRIFDNIWDVQQLE